MPYPEKYGLPCWEKEQAEKCINIVAQVKPEQAPLFLATHSPIKNIKDAKADRLVSEEEAFQNLFTREGEIRGVVRGASGTGKSHLIRWINLRAEYAAKNKELKLDQFKIVMVQRETGSLKAALKQIVDQLGDEFGQYVEAIKSSVNRFSDQAARQELIQELALEINARWEQRHKKSLPKNLKPLGTALLSPDYMQWLGRDEGVVSRIISRLTETSTPEDREDNILFDVNEIVPPETSIIPSRTSEEVYSFIEDMRYEEEFPGEVVEVLNNVLKDAMRELTGIKGAELNDIFTSIRRKLYEQGKQLAVFIEDVTAASGGLDLDLFQAFEPNKGEGLCRMIALLGMTNVGWAVLPENEQDRVDFEFDIGESASHWANDQSEVAKFAARYLNAIRLDDTKIDKLAGTRFTSDVNYSKCDDCPYKESCHRTFGYVQLESDIKIGLFPLSKISPQKLLNSLNQERHRLSPRGLLDLVLHVTLWQSYDNFIQNTFPEAMNFGVIRPALRYWTEFETQYLGGAAWNKLHKERIRFLAEFWINSNSANETATLLEAYRNPFSLPDFSEKPEEDGDLDVGEDEPILQPTPQPSKVDRELNDLLTKIDEWNRGEPLSSDADFRDMISKLISKTMRWQDYRGVPVKFAIETTRGRNPIRIKGQRSRPPAQLYFIDLSRDDQTRDLLEALVRFEREGKRSWNFENGELHKRRVYRWLRNKRHDIIDSLKPNPPELANDAIKTASELLMLSAIITTRSSFNTKEVHETIRDLFTPIWDEENRPQVLSRSLERFVEDLETRWMSVKDLIISEIGVGQGESAPKDFIDPLPIIEAVKNFEENLSVNSLSDEIRKSFWKVRFEAVSKLSAYSNFHKAIADEKQEITNRLSKLREFVVECEYEGKDLAQDIIFCIDQLIEVVKVQRENMSYPNDRFDNLWERNIFQNQKNAWGISIGQGVNVVEGKKNIDVLCYDSVLLEQAYNELSLVTKKHLGSIEKELKERENPGGAVQGGTKEELLSELNQFFTNLDQE